MTTNSPKTLGDCDQRCELSIKTLSLAILLLYQETKYTIVGKQT